MDHNKLANGEGDVRLDRTSDQVRLLGLELNGVPDVIRHNDHQIP